MDTEQQAEDGPRRPIVLKARGADAESARRSPARYFAWAGTGMIGLAAAAGLVAGGTAVWSAFDPGTPGQSPAPLWFPQPATIQPQAATVTPTPDDHGGRRDDPTSAPTSTGSTKSTAEPGDDKGGSSKSTTEPGDDNGGSSKSGSGSGTTTDNSGKASDDPTSAPTTGSSKSTTEPGDDNGGSSKSTTEPGDDNGGSSKSGSGSGTTTDDSGKGSDDESGHR